MKRHAIFTDDTTTDTNLIAALTAAGIDVQGRPLHLQQVAMVAADIINEYPLAEQSEARDNLIQWIDEALDAADEARLKRIEDSIEELRRVHGKLVTWRGAKGCIAIDLPIKFVKSICNADSDEQRYRETYALAKLLLPQLERITPLLMQSALSNQYQANDEDYQRLITLVCKEIESDRKG